MAYPESLPSDVTAGQPGAPGHFNQVLAALRTIHTELGATPKGAATTLTARLLEIEAAVAGTVTSVEVTNLIDGILDGAGPALDTLREIGDAIGDDPDFAATITSLIGAAQATADAAQAAVAALGNPPNSVGKTATRIPQTDGAGGWTYITTPTGEGGIPQRADEVPFDPEGGVGATNVQAAIAELGTSKADLVGGLVPDSQIPAGITRDSELTSAIATALNGVLDGAPGALDTLNELAAAIGDDANYAATVTSALAGKQPLDSDLTSIASLTTNSFGRSLLTLADSSAGRTALGLVIGTNVQAWSAILQATTESFTTALKTKLDGIETGATADQTAAEIKSLYESNTNTNPFTDADLAKLASINGGSANKLATGMSSPVRDDSLYYQVELLKEAKEFAGFAAMPAADYNLNTVISGGFGAKEYVVTDLTDNATAPTPGSLRYGIQKLGINGGTTPYAPQWIRFGVSGKIVLGDAPLRLRPNTTIDGRDADVHIHQPSANQHNMHISLIDSPNQPTGLWAFGNPANWRGAYNPATTYAAGDTVFYFEEITGQNSKTQYPYRALSETTGERPDQNPAKWVLAADLLHMNVILTDLTLTAANRADRDVIAADSGWDLIWINHCNLGAAYDATFDTTRHGGLGRVATSWNRFTSIPNRDMLKYSEDFEAYPNGTKSSIGADNTAANGKSQLAGLDPQDAKYPDGLRYSGMFDHRFGNTQRGPKTQRGRVVLAYTWFEKYGESPRVNIARTNAVRTTTGAGDPPAWLPGDPWPQPTIPGRSFTIGKDGEAIAYRNVIDPYLDGEPHVVTGEPIVLARDVLLNWPDLITNVNEPKPLVKLTENYAPPNITLVQQDPTLVFTGVSYAKQTYTLGDPGVPYGPNSPVATVPAGPDWNNQIPFSLPSFDIGTTGDYLRELIRTRVGPRIHTHASVADGSITTAKLADGAVTTAKVLDAAVTATKLSAVLATRILPDPSGLTNGYVAKVASGAWVAAAESGGGGSDYVDMMLSADYSVPISTTTNIPWSSIRNGTPGMWSAGTPSVVNILTTGLYLLVANFRSTTNIANAKFLRGRIVTTSEGIANEDNMLNGGGGVRGTSISRSLVMTAGQTAAFEVYHTEVTTVDLARFGTNFQVILLKAL